MHFVFLIQCSHHSSLAGLTFKLGSALTESFKDPGNHLHLKFDAEAVFGGLEEMKKTLLTKSCRTENAHYKQSAEQNRVTEDMVRTAEW